MKNDILDNLVSNKTINSYSLTNIDENGNVGDSEYRNTERLTITFNDGQTLVLDTLCSGCFENTNIFISQVNVL